MLSRPARLLLPLALLLLLSLPPEHPPRPVEHVPEPGPAVRIVPPPAELTAPEPEDAPGPPPKAHVIEDCTVTWYTADTCGKSPGHPAYGITASGLPVEEGVTCAVDPEVIPLFSEVYIQYANGTVEQFQATDTGVKGDWVDIYTPDYDYAVQCGLQKLTVYWAVPEEGDDRNA